MPRFCANLTLLFTELPFLDRFAAASAAGFAGVEVLFPYDDPVPEILDRLDRTGLPFVLMNCPPPNYTGGPRGFAAVPGLEDRFRTDFRRAARYAATLEREAPPCHGRCDRCPGGPGDLCREPCLGGGRRAQAVPHHRAHQSP